MNKLNAVVLTTYYEIPISLKEFVILTEWERHCPAGISALNEVLEEKSPACGVDYNGHFGTSIFLTLETQDDTPKTWATIELIINDWIENAEKQCAVYGIVLDL